jgi:hypothetical protein
MKTFRIAGLIFLGVIALFFCWSWLDRRTPPSTQQSPANATNTSIINDAANQPRALGASSASTATVFKRVDPKATAIHAIMAAENAQPQDFYGKAVDQYERPVEGATVLGTLLWIQGIDIGERREQHAVQTDSQGEFQFAGFHASRLAVAITKDGYEMNSRGKAYQAPNQENKTSPTERAVFHMWKLKGAEPMIKARIHAYIPCDGTPTLFDLTTGKKVATGGDLSVRLIRDPVEIVRGRPFTWRLNLEIPEGGLLEVADLYPNEAPADGYQSTITESMSADEKSWSPDLKKTYYFKAENGHDFGRITIDLTGDFQPPPTSFDADIYLNPSGSRNLEYDRSKEIPAKH